MIAFSQDMFETAAGAPLTAFKGRQQLAEASQTRKQTLKCSQQID